MAKPEAKLETPNVLIDPGNAYSTPLESLPLDMPLPYPVFIHFNGRFLLFRNKEDVLTEDRAVTLSNSGVDSVYIRKEDWLAYIDSIEKFVEPSLGSQEYVRHIRSLLLAYGRLLESEVDMNADLLGKIRSLAKILVDVIAVTPEIATQLLKKYKDPNVYFSNHNVNVCVYSIVMGRHLNMSLPMIRNLACGALLHNIGNLYIPKDILYKPGKLTQSEYDLVKEHTTRGAKILKSLNMPPDIVRVASQHHERIDGKGYPEGLRGDNIHQFSKIVSIADVYDAMTNERPYEPAHKPQNAIETMLSMEGKFDPDLLNKEFGGHAKKAS